MQDSGDSYPTQHWQKSEDASYHSSLVVFTAGSTMIATTTFAGKPDDFSWKITIMGSRTGSVGTDPSKNEATYAPGVLGQGHSPNPPWMFGNHYIVKMNGQYYDPSYGLGPYTDLKEYEDDAFEGSIYHESGLYYIKEFPVNNGDATDHSDEINTYVDEVFP